MVEATPSEHKLLMQIDGRGVVDGGRLLWQGLEDLGVLVEGCPNNTTFLKNEKTNASKIRGMFADMTRKVEEKEGQGQGVLALAVISGTAAQTARSLELEVDPKIGSDQPGYFPPEEPLKMQNEGRGYKVFAIFNCGRLPKQKQRVAGAGDDDFGEEGEISGNVNFLYIYACPKGKPVPAGHSILSIVLGQLAHAILWSPAAKSISLSSIFQQAPIWVSRNVEIGGASINMTVESVARIVLLLMMYADGINKNKNLLPFVQELIKVYPLGERLRHNSQVERTVLSDGNLFFEELDKQGRKTGYGYTMFKSGQFQEGTWLGGKKNGEFRIFFADGAYYHVEYRDDKKHGQGTTTWDDGNMYEGEYRDDKRNGQGTYTWDDGNMYEGEWLDNNKHGQGTTTWDDGERYEGEYRDNNRHGQGRTFYPDGSSEEVRYENGVKQ